MLRPIPPPPGQGHLVVHLHTAFARAERSQVPWLSLDGSPVPAVWGRHELVGRSLG